MKKTISTLFMIFAGAFAVQQAEAQSVSLVAGKGGFSKGKTGRASVVMTIPQGLHVNSNQPKSEYAVPTRVTVSAEGAQTGAVSYPAGKMRKFSFSEVPISVYEDKVVFGFNVTVPSNFSGERLRIRARVRYQACTDEVCYAPKTDTVYLNVLLK